MHARWKFVSAFPLKFNKPAGFGASIVLRTILLPGNFDPFRKYRGPKK